MPVSVTPDRPATRSAVGVAAATALVLLSGCTTSDDGPTAATQDATADGGQASEVVVAIGGDEGTLTPYTYVSGYPGWNLLGLVYDTLLTLDEDSLPRPHLATDVEVSDDGLVYTLTLADDVTWHDGTPLTADDVAFTFDYVAANTQSRFTPPAEAVQSVEADGSTVTITLAEPDPGFLVRPLADMPVMPEHVWSAMDDPEAATVAEAVGSGPYVLVEHTPDQQYVLEANPAYALGDPAVERLVLPVVPEQQTAVAALRAGEVDAVTDGVPPGQVDDLEAGGDVEVVTGPEFGSTMLAFDNQRPPFDSPEVRRAVSLAVDVDDLVATVLSGRGTPGDPGFVHPQAPYALASRPHVHDPDQARELLDAAGADEGPDGVRVLDGEPMTFDLLAPAGNPDRVRAAELVRDDLAEVGIDVVVSPVEDVAVQVWPEFDVANGRDYALAMWGWSAPVMLRPAGLADLVDPDPAVGTFNVTGTDDPTLTPLVADVRSAVTTEDAETAAAALADGVAEVVPFVPLYYDDGVYAYDPTAYDGWVFQAGQGILSRLSLVDPATPS